MPWIQVDDGLDDIRHVQMLAADAAKRLDGITADYTRQADVLYKRARGASGGAVAPDLTKSAPQRPKTPTAQAYFEQEMIRHLATAYPGDVRPVEDLHAAQESRKSELTKAAKPDAPPMANAPMPDDSSDLAKFIIGRGLVVAPDVRKEMRDIRALPGHKGGESGAPDFKSGMTEPGGGAKKREARFVQGAGKGEAQMFVDATDASRGKLASELGMLRDLARLGGDEYSVSLAIKSGGFSHSKSLQAIAETPGFSASLRNEARTAADQARRNEASARGEPYLQHGYAD